MDLVIDANIISGYGKEISGYGHDLTGSVSDILNRMGQKDHIYLDKGKQIEKEWRGQAKAEWFDAWLGDRFLDNTIIEISVESCKILIQQLRTKGFPFSKDVWYLRVARAVSTREGKSYLLTEDLDFFDPKKKNKIHGKTRHKFLKVGRGVICIFLRRTEKIFVTCVCNCV